MFSRWGIPEEVYTDNIPQYGSHDGDVSRNAPMRHDDSGELPTTTNQQNPSSHAEIVDTSSCDNYINITKSGRVVRKPDKLDL